MIPIKNIYYMLSYAFQTLKDQGLKDVDLETFENAEQLLSEILIRGVSIQIKRGLNREYLSETDMISSVKGKIDVSDSIKTRSIVRRQLVCTYDDFSTDTNLNRIIKTTLLTTLRLDILPTQKKTIKKLLVYFENVSEINIRNIDWSLHYNRNNQSYQIIIYVCYMLINGFLQSQDAGDIKLIDFIDEQRMSRLYEKFILEYYKKHYPWLSPSASRIKWQLDSGDESLLPAMKSDIMLQHDNTVLIIDAKYYASTTQSQFDRHSVHSENLYQIFTYVKNKEFELRRCANHSVSGMLLYAKTDEEIQPDEEYVMSGNMIHVKTLDLSKDFPFVSSQLNHFADSFYNLHKTSSEQILV